MTNDPTLPEDDGPVTLDEPGTGADAAEHDKNAIWMRLLYMIIFAVLFGVSETILALGAILQFGFLLFTRKRNEKIAEFGATLSDWMRDVARFQTAVTEDKPFPWSET
ncbi:hypothetical protein TG4357_00882 [Thalassovita gelatinovora]|uniref:DUF4389 domain-containing protein n=1 Tax=Thalassovita gelatinovora TaxID=53501 RepID=A0A0P1FRD5_THAGE|nr:DUF4389 domain-containing protein [Thalassovita gelatinovora]QIZ82245.1 DUF4389 domain-containing protein [Thalassovita gelatinovora]CUH63773.1 hypothetical protein TG4357_00882 [Thalassovita gelatinovora]SEQ97885.1 protein of unknown function [Thalassovita gelatinovora]